MIERKYTALMDNDVEEFLYINFSDKYNEGFENDEKTIQFINNEVNIKHIRNTLQKKGVKQSIIALTPHPITKTLYLKFIP